MCKFIYFSENHAIAVIKGKEEHDTIKESLSNVIRDVNHLNDQGNIVVDGRHIELEFYLGGDYEVKNHRMLKFCSFSLLIHNKQANLVFL